MQKMRPITRKGLKRKCDIMWRTIIYHRDKFACQVCGKPGRNAHHIFSKGGYPNMRLSIENGILLCVYHHRAFAHAKTQAFQDWLIKKKGASWYNSLGIQANLSGLQNRKIDYKLAGIYLREIMDRENLI